jgi:hypothetical protein
MQKTRIILNINLRPSETAIRQCDGSSDKRADPFGIRNASSKERASGSAIICHWQSMAYPRGLSGGSSGSVISQVSGVQNSPPGIPEFVESAGEVCV